MSSGMTMSSLKLVALTLFLVVACLSSGLSVPLKEHQELRTEELSRVQRFFGLFGGRGRPGGGGHHGGGGPLFGGGGHHGGRGPPGGGGHHGGFGSIFFPPRRPINGGWGPWVSYGPCSESCRGTGLRQARRLCNTPPPQHGGRPCPGITQRVYVCNRDVPCSVNGGWSGWQASGTCQKSDLDSSAVPCGPGVKKITRSCSNPNPSAGGAPCNGDAVTFVACIAGNCQGCAVQVPASQQYFSGSKPLASGSGVAHGSSVSVSCKQGYQQTSGSGGSTLTCRNGDITGQIIVCEDVNECKSSQPVCDSIKSTCVNTAGGYDCKCKQGFEAGQHGECENVPIQGEWGEWSPSGECSVSCGGGVMEYSRKCDSPTPQHGGDTCSGSDHKTEPCGDVCCPADGGWSDYVDGTCSKTCGEGVVSRTRTCSQPAPECGGRDCEGGAETQATCNMQDCVGCPIPTEPAGVHFVLAEGATSVEDTGELQYTCEDGFTSATDNAISSIACEGGEWSGTAGCNDVNECDLNLNDCNPDKSVCENTEGDFKCLCKDGYEQVGDNCKDIDECEEGTANCEQGCRNDFGGFTCYCQDGYEMEGGKCVSVSRDCSTFPEPANGELTCSDDSTGKTCTCTCDKDYAIPGVGRRGYQICTNGQWDFELKGQEPPDCEEIDLGGLSLSSDLTFSDQGDCDSNADYSVDLFSLDLGSATCNGGGLKRSTGSLSISVTVQLPVPAQCDGNCMEKLRRQVVEKQAEINKRAASGKVKVKITNLATSKKSVLKLKGKGLAGEIVTACADGLIKTIVDSEEKCVPCSRGTYYSVQTLECRACPKGTYSSSPGQVGVQSCTACPQGQSTVREGSKAQEACQVSCQPGHSSESGFAPCDPCPRGTYASHPGSSMCRQCPYQLTTLTAGSTAEKECVCEDPSRYWQGCSKECVCKKGGRCLVDGDCLCPKGWIGRDCSKQDLVTECQDQYYVRMIHQVKATEPVVTFLMSSSQPGAYDLDLVKVSNGEVVASESGLLEACSHMEYSMGGRDQTLHRIGLYPSDKMQALSYSKQSIGLGAYSPLPIQAFHAETSETYLTIGPSLSGKKYQSMFAIIATRDDTVIKVTPSQDAFTYYSEQKALEKQTATTYTAQENQYIKIQSNADLSGSKVESNFPIVLLSGHECGRITKANTRGCDYAIEQLPAIRLWGDCYIAVPASPNYSELSIVRIASEDAEADISIQCMKQNGQPSTSRTVRTKSNMYEFTMQASDYCSFHSPGSVFMVTQFFSTKVTSKEFTGPSMVVLPKSTLKANNVPFFIPATGPKQFITITVPTGDFNSANIFLDSDSLEALGATTAVEMNTVCGDFTVTTVEVNQGYHLIHHSDPESGFQAVVHGSTEDGAYAYAPGVNQGYSCSKLA